MKPIKTVVLNQDHVIYTITREVAVVAVVTDRQGEVNIKS